MQSLIEIIQEIIGVSLFSEATHLGGFFLLCRNKNA